MKIAGIIISDSDADICDRQSGTLQKKCCLIQPLDLKQYLIGSAQESFDRPAEPWYLITQQSGQFCQLAAPIIFINVSQNLEDQLLVEGLSAGLDTVGVVHQLQE